MLRVKGQSFMLHQIRKMVGKKELKCGKTFQDSECCEGMVITVAQGLAGEDIIQRAWGGDRVGTANSNALEMVVSNPWLLST